MANTAAMPQHATYAQALAYEIAKLASTPLDWVNSESMYDIANHRNLMRVHCLGVVGNFYLDMPVNETGLTSLYKAANEFAMLLWGEPQAEGIA